MTISSVEEQTALRKAQAIGRIPVAPSYENIDGWSRCPAAGKVGREALGIYAEKDAKVVIQVNGKPTTLVMNSGFITHQAFIDLIRPGEPPQRIWYLDKQTHRVSRAEYERTFSSKGAVMSLANRLVP